MRLYRSVSLKACAGWMVCLAVAIVSHSAAFAQGAPSSSDEVDSAKPANTISVTGHADMSSAPDIARISVTVTSVNKNENKAVQANAAKMQGVVLALHQAGIADADIQTQRYSSQNYYGPGSGDYIVINSQQITIHDLSALSSILLGVTQAGGSVAQVDFGLLDPTHVRAETLAAAAKDARAKAEAAADALDVHLGRVESLIEHEQGAPPPPIPSWRPFGASDFTNNLSTAPLTPPQNILLSADVTVAFDIAP